jgi:peptide/nickel transport system permease protein
MTSISAADLETRASASFWTQVIRQTFGHVSARIGSIWIGIVAFCAVFTPLLANTWPILVKIDGRWSSPLARHLTPSDVILLALGFSVIVGVIFLRRVSVAKRSLWLGIILVVTGIPAFLFVHPPLTNDYRQFRDLERAGKIQYKLMAPMPLSANDYQRDFPDQALQPPSWAHPMGTEVDGADLLSRMIYACRIALAIGLVATSISLAIGIFVGGIMGYFVGRVDLIGMRLIEIFEAIPTLFLLITFVAFYGRNLYLMMAIIGLTGWTGGARYIRAEFLRLRQQDFVQAAVASGLPLRSIIFRHLLPNGIAPLLVSASFGIASAILYESTLSFLGLGLIEEPSWGQMLEQARGIGGNFVWWIALYPGLAIFLTVFSYNLLGESLRDALDPKARA